MRDHFPVLDTLVLQNFSTGVPLWESVFQYSIPLSQKFSEPRYPAQGRFFQFLIPLHFVFIQMHLSLNAKVCQYSTLRCKPTQKKSNPFIATILKTFFTINSLVWEHLEKHVMVFCRFFSLKQIHSNPGIALNLVSTYYPSETIWMSTGGYPYNHP